MIVAQQVLMMKMYLEMQYRVKDQELFSVQVVMVHLMEQIVLLGQQHSDRRIKKNIVDNTTGLSIINQLQVRNYEYKTENEIKTDNPELTDVIKSAVVNKTGTQIGLIAQEAEAVLASCVYTGSTGIKILSTDEIFWYMLNAIKELSAKVTALEAG